MLDQRRRRWANIEPTLFQSLVFVGIDNSLNYNTVINPSTTMTTDIILS